MYEAASRMPFKCGQMDGASQGFLCNPAQTLSFTFPSTNAGRACLQRRSRYSLGNSGGIIVISV